MVEPASLPLGDLIERFDHVSLAVNRVVDALPLVEMMGGRFWDGGIQRHAGFRWVQFDLPGSGKLEMIEPLNPLDQDHFLVRFLASKGEGVHHLTFKVNDIEAAIARARALGLSVVGVSLKDAAWKEAFIHPKSANGVLMQIAEWEDLPASGCTLEDFLSGAAPR